MSTQIDLAVRTSGLDIERYLRAEGSQLKILRALALSDPQSWNVRLVANAQGGTNLMLEAAKGFDPLHLFDGRIPEILSADEVILSWPEGELRLTSPLSQVLDKGVLTGTLNSASASESTKVTLLSFMKHAPLDPAWMW